MSEGIYNAVLLDHARHPRNKGIIEPADYSYEDDSFACGDEVRIDVRVTDRHIAAIAFSGRGCAVSQASASILTEMVEGMSLVEVQALTKDDLMAIIGVTLSPSRITCALLSWRVLSASLFGVDPDVEM
ncbi:MAG: iron-sulfur cluster assembly scaffold protein [Thermomicrobiales bacterium]